MADDDNRALDDVERYRRAAEDALQQLDWCIGYLHGIRKIGISKALARNRSYIRTNLMERPEQPLPTIAAGDESASRAPLPGRTDRTSTLKEAP
jgi:hypothetical protein